MDKKYIGIILGIILPAITTWFLYKYSYGGQYSWDDFVNAMIMLNSMSTMLAVACLSNLAVFTIFAYTDKLNIARGLIISTVLWAIVIVVFKFIIQ